MFSVTKGASTYLKQIGRATATGRVGANVAKKSTSSVSMDHNNFSDKEDSVENTAFSNTISFSSPESDFCTPHMVLKSNFVDLENYSNENDASVETAQRPEPTYSGQLSFTSPEADFTSGSVPVATESETETAAANRTKEQREAELAKDTFFQKLEEKSEEHSQLSYSLSYATPESDFTNPVLASMLDKRQKKQLENANATLLHNHANQLTSTKQVLRENSKQTSNEYQELRAHAELLSHEDPLPTNMEEATISSDDRAIVITEAEVPFKIVTVNSAWESLCGYTKDECSGKTLDCIQGPETNEAAITALMAQLLRGEEAGTVLVNYKKDGSKFLNRLRVGALRDDNNSVTHFVGVLKEVEEMTDNFSGASRILVQD